METRLRTDLRLPRNIRRSIEKAGNPVIPYVQPKRCSWKCLPWESDKKRVVKKNGIWEYYKMTKRDKSRHKNLH